MAFYPQKKYERSELRLVASGKGWRGPKSTSREELLKWLADRGVSADEIATTVDGIRRMARGQVVQPQVGAAALSEAAIAKLVDERVSQVARSLTGGVDEGALRKLVLDAVSKAQPARIILDEKSGKSVKLTKRTHPLFEKTLRCVRAGLNVMLVGPAGCGKTTLGQHIAEALKRRFGVLNGTSGASESHMSGWLLPVGANGQFVYVPAEFVECFEDGDSLFLIDEGDGLDPNMLLMLNSALANGYFTIPHRYKKPRVIQGKNSAIMMACNTYGTGADILYAGRNQLDAATLDRFYIIEMDYDPALEAEITGMQFDIPAPWQAAPKATGEELKHLGEWVMNLRKKVQTNRLRRVVSTRTFQKAIAARLAGIPTEEVKKDLLAGWTRDELAKVGEVV